MKFTSEKLYAHYTNQSPACDGIKARLKQRSKWIDGFNKYGKFKNKLKAIGLLNE